MYQEATRRGWSVDVIQVAESEGQRVGLGKVDLSYHRYPYELLYRGSLDHVPLLASLVTHFRRGWASRADFVIVQGYAELRNWAQLAGLILGGTPRGVFCDSTLNESSANPLIRLAKRLFFSRCDLIFCYGERASDMAAHFGARPNQIVRRCQSAALPHGYDPTAVPRQRAAARPAAPRFLYVGRLAAEKNLFRLIEAFALARRDLDTAELRVVGNGPLRDELIAHAEKMGVASSVHFLGGMAMDAISAEYLAATALILPSLREPWGLVVNEALAFGCPVVVSDLCGCVPELVLPRVSGVVFDPHDVPGLAARLVEVEKNYGAPELVERRLELIGNYTPDAAATEILDGVATYLNGQR
ncbi:glycosyltransferase [Sphingomonas sp. GlSt437]|uniref:glycosyltransferase n=1 Tax=Sphingomonas sp. GlSt437 TaxID=3389970 RepID=UPI003A86D128